MSKLIRYIFISFMAMVLGCIKDVDIKLPEYIPALTVHSYISPMDSGMIVYVNLSKSAYDNNFYDLMI